MAPLKSCQIVIPLLEQIQIFISVILETLMHFKYFEEVKFKVSLSMSDLFWCHHDLPQVSQMLIVPEFEKDWLKIKRTANVLPALLSQPAIDDDVTDDAVDVLLQKSRSKFAQNYFQDYSKISNHLTNEKII